MKILELPSIICNCEYCNTKLSVSLNDTEIGWLGARYYTCPICGESNMVEEFPIKTLTKEEFSFPEHFTRFSKNVRHCVHIDESRVKEERTKLLSLMDDELIYTFFGDLLLVVIKEEKESFSVESHDYYEGSIDFNISEGCSEYVIHKCTEEKDSINEYLQTAIDWFYKNPDTSFFYKFDKNLFIMALNNPEDGEVTFYVTENFKKEKI